MQGSGKRHIEPRSMARANQPHRNDGVHDTLLGKGAKVYREVARSLLLLKEGERIPGIPDYARAYSAGFGTVQKAFALLCSIGAIQTSAQGAKGTFLAAKSSALLWRCAALPAIACMVPLPISAEHESLATALTVVLEEMQIPYTLSYTHGAYQRVLALLEGRCDVVALSHRSAESACAQYPALVPVIELRSCLYYSPNALVVLLAAESRQREGPMRIGIDHKSADQEWLTLAEFPNEQMVPVHCSRMPELVAQGVIDAAVWNATSRGAAHSPT
jgi:DNA-binding transcriptional regulator YhcF (GntR family)